jgi:cytochrome c oxidase subunit 2
VGRPTLRSHEENRAPRGGVRRGAALLVAGASAVALSGCTDTVERGWLPSTKDTTNHTERIMALWNGSWIAALLVGALVWGLILWCVVAYRRRRNETGVPAQIRYHIPLEIMYTIIPLMMVGVLFFYTARDQAAIAETNATPDLTVNVVGKQWAWDFNYLDDQVYDTGVQGQLTGKPGVEDELPTLYLPVNEMVEFQLTTRDVNHSFWIPAFLYKMDLIAGVVNRFQVRPTKVGTFQGKCAELCGEYHSEMLFNVRVVPRPEYDAHVAELRRRGQTGTLDSNLGRSITPTQGPEGAEGVRTGGENR